MTGRPNRSGSIGTCPGCVRPCNLYTADRQRQAGPPDAVDVRPPLAPSARRAERVSDGRAPSERPRERAGLSERARTATQGPGVAHTWLADVVEAQTPATPPSPRRSPSIPRHPFMCSHRRPAGRPAETASQSLAPITAAARHRCSGSPRSPCRRSPLVSHPGTFSTR